MPIKWICLALILTGLTACSSTNHVVENGKIITEKQIVEQKPQISTNVLWRVNVGDLGTDVGYALQPSNDDKRLYVINREGVLRAFDLASGVLLYTKPLMQEITAGISVGDNLIYAVNRAGSVLGIDKHSGNIQWRLSLDVGVVAPLSYRQGLLVVRSIDGGIFAIDAATGELRWQYHIHEPILGIRGNIPVIISDNGLVIAATDSGNIYFIEQNTGTLVAERPLPIVQLHNDGSYLSMPAMESPPIISGNQLFASITESATYAVNLNQGYLAWMQSDAIAAHHFTEDLSALYLQDIKGHVFALNKDNGEIIWKNNGVEGRGSSPVWLMAADHIAVMDSHGYISWFNAHSGAIVAQEHIGRSGMNIAPIVLANMAILTLTDGEILAIRPRMDK